MFIPLKDSIKKIIKLYTVSFQSTIVKEEIRQNIFEFFAKNNKNTQIKNWTDKFLRRKLKEKQNDEKK